MPTSKSQTTRLFPTGECWCGCGNATASVGAFFIHGHDRRAEAAVILKEYGSIPLFMREHGYGPGGKNALATWKILNGRRSTPKASD